MRVIKDLKDRKWELQITVGTVKRVRSLCDIDLYDITDGGFLNILIDDPVKFIDLLWVVFEEQAEKHEVTEEQFGQGWAGEVVDEATKLFLEELVNFFPEKKRRPTKKILEKFEMLAEKASKRAEVEVDSLTEADMDIHLDTEMEKMKQK